MSISAMTKLPANGFDPPRPSTIQEDLDRAQHEAIIAGAKAGLSIDECLTQAILAGNYVLRVRARLDMFARVSGYRRKLGS